MNIYKVGHSCVVVSDGETRILVDPGIFTSVDAIPDPDTLTGLIYTHSHADHYSHKNLLAILEKNPELPIWTNAETGALLEKDGHTWTQLENGSQVSIGEIELQTWEVDHHPIHEQIPIVQNLVLFFNKTFLHPGDALFVPDVPVPVLAVPFGPFATIGECMQYGLDVKPERIIPLHDGYMKTPGPYLGIPKMVWTKVGIAYEWLHNEEAIDT